MTLIYMARHGETDWNRESRWQGHADPQLNARGRRQARLLAEQLVTTPLAAVYSSDLRRAMETASIVAADHQLAVIPLSTLREIDVGSWSGMLQHDIAQRFPAEFAGWLKGSEGWRDGETYSEMSDRFLGAILHIASAHPNDCVFVAVHGDTLSAVHAEVLGVPISEYRRSASAATPLLADGSLEPNGRLWRLEVRASHLSSFDLMT